MLSRMVLFRFQELGKKEYCLENRKDTMLKARIRLREKTLLKWIELVEKPESWKKQKSKKKSKEKILALA